MLCFWVLYRAKVSSSPPVKLSESDEILRVVQDEGKYEGHTFSKVGPGYTINDIKLILETYVENSIFSNGPFHRD